MSYFSFTQRTRQARLNLSLLPMAHQKRHERSSATPLRSEKDIQQPSHSPFHHGRPLDKANLTADTSTSVQPPLTRSGSPLVDQLDIATSTPRTEYTSEEQQQTSFFNDHSSLFDQVSRIECQFDQLSLMGDNATFSDQVVQYQNKEANRSAKSKGLSTSSSLKEQEKVLEVLLVTWSVIDML